MDKSWIEKQIEELKLDEIIKLEEIPDIDLYMDQLITLFENKLSGTKRYEEDKLLTKTMINNYTKDKVLMPAVKKKYTKEHIILMIMLYQFKNSISITDIKDLFSLVKNEGEVESDKLEVIYQNYLQLKQNESQTFNRSVEEKMDRISEVAKEHQDIETFLLVATLIEQANYNKKLAERIIDMKIKESNKK